MAVMDVETLGAGAPRLVTLHGIQGTRAAWLPVASQLAAEGGVVLPNLRGRGRAVRGSGPADYTLDRYAEDLHELLLSRIPQDRPFFLAGWSMGVSVILDYLQRPAALQPVGLVLLSGSPWLAGTRWFSGEGGALLAEVAAREQRLGLREAADHDAVAWTWRAIGRTDQRSVLPRLRWPTLILHGSADEDSPWSHARMLADGIAGAELVGLAGAGHGLLAQRTEAVAREMRRFMARVTSTEKHHAT